MIAVDARRIVRLVRVGLDLAPSASRSGAARRTASAAPGRCGRSRRAHLPWWCSRRGLWSRVFLRRQTPLLLVCTGRTAISTVSTAPTPVRRYSALRSSAWLYCGADQRTALCLAMWRPARPRRPLRSGDGREAREPAAAQRDAGGGSTLPDSQVFDFQMDISRDEQRVLHTLAQGGNIHALKDDKGRITAVECYNRDGWLMSHCNLFLFRKLRNKKAIARARTASPTASPAAGSNWCGPRSTTAERQWGAAATAAALPRPSRSGSR